MDDARWDENGWAVGLVTALPAGEAFSLFAAGADARADESAWSHAASRFFGARLALASPKRYPTGASPLADVVELDVARGGEPATRVHLRTVPIDRAAALRVAANAAVAAIGGAGFDALLPRARRVWQVEARVAAGDARAPLAVAAVLASVLLAPILPPEGGSVFGVKGARERLTALGWG